MRPVLIKPDIYWIGVNDRTTDLFEGLWPITREGVSYNAYLINDEKKALIDLSKSFKSDEFFDQIDSIINLARLDYVIVNHMEPDHSGVLTMLRRMAPQVTILGTQKTKEMLELFYGITENVYAVADGEMLNLGTHTLKFFVTPFVHWPETMMTYDVGEQVLFSCDAFGSYGALSGALFDDECTDHEFYRREALRYYVNIVALFSTSVLKAIDKLSNVPVSVVAPSHGLIWRTHPETIVGEYKRWAEYADRPGEAEVTLMYGSMYGNTEKMMNAVAQGIAEAGLPVHIFDVAHTHVSYILPSLWVNRGVMVGAPTYEGKLFPLMKHALSIAVDKRVRNKLATRFGSYGWSGGAQKDFEALVAPLKWTLSEPFEFVGAPSEQDLRQGEAFGRRFGEWVKSANAAE